jgi:hypothetical protein
VLALVQVQVLGLGLAPGGELAQARQPALD